MMKQRQEILHLKFCSYCVCWLFILAAKSPRDFNVESLVLPTTATRVSSQQLPFSSSSKREYVPKMSSLMEPPLVVNKSKHHSGGHRSTLTIPSSTPTKTINIIGSSGAITAASAADPNKFVRELSRRKLSSKPRTTTTSTTSRTNNNDKTVSRSSTMPRHYRIATNNTKNKKKVFSTVSSLSKDSSSVARFVSEIHGIERLSVEEELELAYLVQQSVQLQELFDTLREKFHRDPTNEEWVEYSSSSVSSTIQSISKIHEIIEKGLQAKNKLVTANLRMVQYVVNMYVRNGLGSKYNIADMMSEGTLALILAAEKYDPARGFRFSTYAMYWIRAYVKKSQIVQSSVIYVPPLVHDTHKKICEIVDDLTTLLQRKPSIEEVAKFSKMKKEKIEQVLFAVKHQQCFSLDASIMNFSNDNTSNNNQRRGKPMVLSSDNKNTLYDLVACQKEDVSEIDIREEQLTKDDLINSMRRYLSPHEVTLILLKFGLVDDRFLPHRNLTGRPLTISEVAQLVGLKPSKARRLINRSLNRLKSLISHEWNLS